MLPEGLKQGSGTDLLPPGRSLPLPCRQTQAGGEGWELPAESDLLNRVCLATVDPVLLQPVTCSLRV